MRSLTYTPQNRDIHLGHQMRVFRQLWNGGPGSTRSRALEAAQGRYLAFLDGDDLWRPEKLERQLSFMTQHWAVFSFIGYRVISPEGADLDCIDRIPLRMWYADLFKNTVIGCSTVVLDRQSVGEVRFPDIRTSEDLAVWLGILKAGHVAFGMPDLLTRYRITPQSSSRNKAQAALHVWHVMRHHEGLPLGRALWYFGNYAVRGLVKHLQAR